MRETAKKGADSDRGVRVGGKVGGRSGGQCETRKGQRRLKHIVAQGKRRGQGRKGGDGETEGSQAGPHCLCNKKGGQAKRWRGGKKALRWCAI